MSTGVGVHETVEPGDWQHPAERTYADRQRELASIRDVDITSHTFESGDMGRVHYLTAGNPDGAPVLLLHGLSSTAATWLPMASPLLESYQLIMPDRPGRGLSSPASYADRDLEAALTTYLVDLLDELAIDRPHVVGNSLGGLQAFFLALDEDRVDRLCLVGGPGGLTRSFPPLFRLMTVRGVNRLIFWAMRRGDPVESARKSMEQFNVEDPSDISMAFYELLASHQDLPDRTWSLRSLANQAGSYLKMHPMYDRSEEIVDIERPTSFVWGSEDAFFDPEVGRGIADRMVDAEFHELPGHGHTPWMEPTDEVEQLVAEFLDA